MPGITSSMLRRQLPFFIAQDGGLFFKTVLVTSPITITSSKMADLWLLPLFHIESRLFGNRLTSTPFCVVGSPVSE